jgi:hypothetical protein
MKLLEITIKGLLPRATGISLSAARVCVEPLVFFESHWILGAANICLRKPTLAQEHAGSIDL